MHAETRPGPLEDWLDSLPYADFDHATRPMLEALRQTNSEKIKPSVRMQIAELYARPYEYLLDTHIRNRQQSGLQSMDRHLQQLETIRAIATEIAFCCRQAIDEALTRRTRWINSKPPVRCMLLAMRTLSHRLLLCYQSYAPMPRNVWHELHDLYATAEKLGVLDQTVICDWRDDEPRSSLGSCYRQIAATSLVDPHHLPEAAAWAIHEQLGQWQRSTRVVPFSAGLHDCSGLFVLALMGDHQPEAIARCPVEEHDVDTLRLLDCTALCTLVQKLQQQLRGKAPLPDDCLLPAEQAAVLVQHLIRAWGLPPRRNLPREQRQGSLQLASGLHAAFNQITSDRQQSGAGSAPVEEDMEQIELQQEQPSSPVSMPSSDSWEFINAGPGGFSVYKGEPPASLTRVGDLVVMRGNDQEQWQLGLIRWLMVQKNREHRIGIQFISEHARAVSFSHSGSKLEHEGFLLTGKHTCLFAQRGTLRSGRELRIPALGDDPVRVVGQQVEATAVVEQFVLITREAQQQQQQ